MLNDGKCRSTGFTLLQQILSAHEALQLGEFAHHLADQIVFAEMGGASRCRCHSSSGQS